MAASVHFSRLVLPALAIAILALSTMTVHGQVGSGCTASMLTSFTPCMNFVTNSTSGGAATPTSDCCTALKSLTSNGTDCLCLIATGSPFQRQIPINRTLAISLPKACKMPGVPLQCKVPAPGPTAFTPTAPLSPTASVVPTAVAPALAPEADTTPSSTSASQAPPANSGIRPQVTPSAADTSLSFSPALLVTLLGASVLKYYY